MTDLGRSAVELIERARKADLAPGAEVDARVLRGIRDALEGGVAGEDRGLDRLDVPQPGVGYGAWVAKIMGLGLLGGIVGLAIGLSRPDPPATPTPIARAVALTPEPPRAPEPKPRVRAQPSTVPPPQVEDVRPETKPAPRPPPRAKPIVAAPAKTLAKKPKPDLAAEARLLARASRALAAGDHGRVLAIARQHARLFPGGQMIDERQALRILAHCGAGRVGDARAVARDFYRRFTSSPHVARVRNSCARKPNPK